MNYQRMFWREREMENKFSVEDGKLPGVKIIHPFYREDQRGYFLKSFEQRDYELLGLNNVISEEFDSFSKKGVIRGMHFQKNNPQIKMVRVIRGCVHDIIVDLRNDSSTYGEYEEFILSEQNHNILWIPEGFAHGFEVLSEDAIMSYKCFGKYEAESDTGIRWNDEELRLPWKTEFPIVSERDRHLPRFSDYA